jgi:hypothetical protein
MGAGKSRVPNLRAVKAFRGQSLIIDLGKVLDGTLTAWMKRDPEDVIYRSFEIKENRYLFLPKVKAEDYYNSTTLELESKVEGKWYFDVKQLLDGETVAPIIFTGTIDFSNNITDSNGVELTEPFYPWATKLTDLQDTPSSLGNAGQTLVVNPAEDGTEWIDQPADKHYVHSQNSASKTWTVVHNLQKHPAVSITDSGGSLVVGNITYLSLDTVEITFNASFSGIAYFN